MLGCGVKKKYPCPSQSPNMWLVAIEGFLPRGGRRHWNGMKQRYEPFSATKKVTFSTISFLLLFFEQIIA